MVTETNETLSAVERVALWRLEHEVDYTREAIIKRSRWLAERLTRMANGLEDNHDFSINTLGELQGNGVELDAMCMKLGFARETLKDLRRALEQDGKEA